MAKINRRKAAAIDSRMKGEKAKLLNQKDPKMEERVQKQQLTEQDRLKIMKELQEIRKKGDNKQKKKKKKEKNKEKQK